ncbi:O-succinylbenzoic acid--CoA ligase [hydrothermal vent metagenome]|uniref:O-succinylbenzoic acid--CoA ligase n=1 Tax=hydrothermal vent metagenome TaxID=652676 RepID=A0A3B0V4G6_9ZZZZ
MKDWLHERTAVTPHKLALIIGEQRWNYAQLNQLVDNFCHHLQKVGVQPSDFVAALLPNDLPYVCLIHALARLGAILVPLNSRLAPAELRWQLEQVEANWLVSDQEVEWLIVNCKLLMVNEAWFKQTTLTINHYPFTINHYQAVVFTSGTSGKPKGVMLTFANHFQSATASAYRLGVQPDDVWLSVLPLYHVGGLAVLFRGCLYGTAVSLHTHFGLQKINHDLDNNRITLISLVPTMLHRLLQTRDSWPASLRLILLGGAAATPELVARANDLPRKPVFSDQSSEISEQLLTINHLPITINHPPLVATTYGLTEAASQVATMPPAEAAHKPGSVGKPLMFTHVKIVDEDGKERPSNKIGEIIVTGPTVMAGYYKKRSSDSAQSSIVNPKSSIQNRQSSIATGDLGYLDADGDLWLVQRRSDLIVTGGENVYPAEVEAVLRKHTAVSQACVVGIPDVEWGQRVVAMVQMVGETVSPQELIKFCRDHLAGYKIPRQIEIVIQLPLTASGKIARQIVAEQLAQAYFQTSRWQEGEQEAQDDIDNGRITRFDDIDDALDFLDNSP